MPFLPIIFRFILDNWRTVVAGLLVTAIVGWIGWLIHSRDMAVLESTKARSELLQYKQAYITLSDQVQQQNEAIYDLQKAEKERSAKATKAVQDSKKTAQVHLQIAKRFQGLRPPKNQDECHATESLIQQYLEERKN